MKHIVSRILRFQYLIAAGGVRLKKIPRTKNLADILTHTPSAKEMEVFLPLMSLKSCRERDKELMATKQKTSSSWECENVIAWLTGVLNSFVYSSHSRHVSSWLIVFASYDEYTALVKSGNVASTRLEHSMERIAGGNLDTVTLLSDVTFLVICALSLVVFLQHA